VRSRMMAKVPCDLTIADLCEYNTEPDAGEYSLIAIRQLDMSSMQTELTNGRL
jgi:hypothetical protein